MPIPSVELSTAQAPVLESLWRYLVLPAPVSVEPDMGHPGKNGYGGWDPALSWPDSRAGLIFGGNPMPCDNALHMIYPDEAARLAAQAMEYRKAAGAGIDWQGFYEHLVANAASNDSVYPAWTSGDGKIFRTDMSASVPPVAHLRRAQMLADLAFAAVFPDPNPLPFEGSFTWSGWGFPRATGAPGVSMPFVSQADWSLLSHVHLPYAGYPVLFGPYVPGTVYGDPGAPFLLWYHRRPLAPVALTLRPPTRFSVASSGWRLALDAIEGEETVSGSLETMNFLRFSGQEDFENGSGGADLFLERGILAENDFIWPDWPNDQSRRGLAEDALADTSLPGPPRTYRHVATWPLIDHASAFFSSPRPPPPAPPLAQYYPRAFGGIALAGREGGAQGAQLYFPFSERTPAGPSSPFAPEDRLGNLLPISMCVDEPDEWPMRFWPGGETVYPHTTPLYTRGSYLLEEGGALPDGCPGMPAGVPIQALTVSGWLVPTGPINTFGGFEISGASHILSLGVNRSSSEGPLPALKVSLRIGSAGGWFPVWTVSDDGDTTGFWHVALVVERVPPVTRFRLFVNGRAVSDPVDHVGDVVGGLDETLAIHQMDEVRIHTLALQEPHVRKLFEIGRFVRKGTYISPLYRSQTPLTLRRAQWIGLTPPSFKDAGGAPVDPFRIELIGYVDEDGMTPAGPPAVLADGVGASESGRWHDLAFLGFPVQVRSFRYRLTLDATNVAEAPIDSPLFESIALGYQAGRRGPGWSTWDD